MEELALQTLGSRESVNTLELANEENVDHVALVGMMKSLTADGFANMEQKQLVEYRLSNEGQATAANGSPEFLFLVELEKQGGMSAGDASKSFKVGMGPAMKNKWAKKDKESGKIVPVMASSEVEDQLKLNCLKISNGETVSSDEEKILKKRNQIEIIKTTYFICTKGPQYAPTRTKPEQALTAEMLKDGSWKDKTFKETNFHSLGAAVSGGYLHPSMQVRSEFRKIMLGMGFSEMPTSQWCLSSFWNFDSLFQPQQHPARDAHDTFFIKEPAMASLESTPASLVEDVKNMHEVGGHGSVGYRYKWSLDEAKKNILRTHTTAVSSRMLHMIANQPGGFKPQKYFSIDRVFRNETLDKTHLAEFHQVEGLVADYNLSLGDLIGVIKNFFTEIGLEDVKFKPAYNPYTEPSMEIFGKHPTLGWTEVGNSGMFRPEMLKPLGLPDGVRVIAWGLALERPVMIAFQVPNIRELFGHEVNLAKNRNERLPLLRTAKAQE